MLTDYSPGYTDTWQQLERRIDDVLWLGSAAQSAAALPQLLLQALAGVAAGGRGTASAAAAGPGGQQNADSGSSRADASSSSSSSSSSVAGSRVL